MRRYLTASASIAALMLVTAPADAAASRQQCFGFSIFGQQFDCNHDRPDGHGGVPDFSRPEPSGDDDDDDDTPGGDGDGDGDHDCKDGGGKGGKY